MYAGHRQYYKSGCIDDELPFEIPENWCWCRLGTLVAVLGGKRIPAGRKLTSDNTGHVYIRVSDMKDGGVNTDNLLYVPEDIYPSISKYIISSADVFITVAGTIGRVGKIPAELDGSNLTENADRLVCRLPQGVGAGQITGSVEHSGVRLLQRNASQQPIAGSHQYPADCAENTALDKRFLFFLLHLLHSCAFIS